MKLSISMVQNEGDIIEYFVRANLRFLDFMVVVCNPSGDDTRRILSDLVAEGAPLALWDTSRNNYDQSVLLTYCHKAVKEVFCPDFTFFLDADEILSEKSCDSLDNELARHASTSVALLPWKTHVPDEKTQYQFSPGRFATCLAQEYRQYYKIVIPKRLASESDIVIQPGAHSACKKNGEQLRACRLHTSWLAHVPIRSEEQLRAKTLGGVLTSVIVKGENWYFERESFQWKKLFKKLLKGQRVEPREAALRYLIADENDPSVPEVRGKLIRSRLPSIKCKYSVNEVASDTAIASRVFFSLVRQPSVESILVGPKLPPELNRIDADHTGSQGVFSAVSHYKTLKCDWPPFRYVVDLVRPKSVLDVGCGLGAYLKLFKQQGAAVFGIDGSEYSDYHFVSYDEYAAIDLSKGHFPKKEAYDLVLCLEVAEHLPEQVAETLVEYLVVSANDVIVFSAAQPGQPGRGHIHLRPLEYWVSLFEKRGWVVDAPATLAARLLATLHWFRRNLLVLKKHGQRDALKTGVYMAKIEAISEQKTKWPSQSGSKIVSFCGDATRYALSDNKMIEPLDSDDKIVESLDKNIVEGSKTVGKQESRPSVWGRLRKWWRGE